jgi:hypothetical protein
MVTVTVLRICIQSLTPKSPVIDAQSEFESPEIQVFHPAGENVWFDPQAQFTGSDPVAEMYNLTLEMLPDALSVVRHFDSRCDLACTARSIPYALSEYELQPAAGIAA